MFGSYDDTPGEPNFFSQYRNLLHHYVHQTGNEDASTFWGACGAIRRDIFMKMNGFDEGYARPSIEDIELGYRLKQAGHRIFLAKDIQITHLKRWTLWSMLSADFFCRALPWTRLILENGGFVNDLNLKVSSRVSVICAWMMVLALAGSLFSPWLAVSALVSAFALAALNKDVCRFFL